MTDTQDHEIVVRGIWRGDSCADVGLWCNTCEAWLSCPGGPADEYETPTGLTLDELAQAAAAHNVLQEAS